MVTGLATVWKEGKTMGYRKARIPIRTKGVIEYRDGYKFDACFSNGELFEMGVYKSNKKQWNISDVNTGLAVCYGVTRIDAVKKFQDVYLSKLERYVMSNEHYSSSPTCHENFYEHQTAEFQAMLKEGAK